VRVERHHALLQIGAAARGVLHVHAVAHHDRRGSAAVRDAPEKVLTVERPLFRQAGFLRDAVAVRSAGFGPVANRDPTPLLGEDDGSKAERQDGCEAGRQGRKAVWKAAPFLLSSRLSLLPSCHFALLHCPYQKLTPARNPNVRGAPGSPTNPEGARPAY